MKLSTLEIGTATLQKFRRNNRSPIRFGFRTGAKAIQYGGNIV